eukprot:CAMPEP_0184483278 /NCGR_PEP_ID=MMETSP0113_2-20130426/4919_1 /TAXON_ID=91329 /ORGANISM="Norrisiella sphaerica, Strain BC52" /LENGTH=1098 /DNA_ID=CAMNT_0026863573 /DNA_START=200 /DNA_END=3496 /DNA_ORIENTATION=-
MHWFTPRSGSIRSVRRARTPAYASIPQAFALEKKYTRMDRNSHSFKAPRSFNNARYCGFAIGTGGKLSSGLENRGRATTSSKTVRATVIPRGYEVVKSEELSEYAAKATILKHTKTGAEVLSLEKDDDNKVFGIAFRTPVDDSKGIPHILEHSVLCGSRKYPAKSPFIELRKSSLHTFLNAMTYPDRTLYPVASQNDKDFYNLADVYLDSVLHPKAKKDPLVMAQEGWHYELKDMNDPLTIKGVVYNEMKGVYSSPDSLHGRGTVKALFPDVNYAEDSGGDPEVIPSLTYEEFKSFHDRYYHPSNARIFFYGNDNVQKRFELLDKYLDEFEPLPEGNSHSALPTQIMKRKPWRVDQFVPVAKGQEEKKTYATLGWVVSEDSLSEEEDLAWSIIDQLLTGNTAAKLRKTLIDSGLGSSVIGGGLSTYLKQPFYTIGLKGLSDADAAEKLQTLVLDTLKDVVDEGFDKETLDAALNRVEFALREFDTASVQRGMAFLSRAMSDWNYDRDPLEGFKFEKTLNLVKKKLDGDPTYLQNIIQRRLIDNQHRVLIVSSPDPTIEEAKEKKLQKDLERIKTEMSVKELEQIVELTGTLTDRQAAPDDPEAIKTIPRLSPADLDTATKHISRETTDVEGVTVLQHEQSTNGILYMDYAIDITDIDIELLPLMNLFTRIASGATGTAEKDRVKLRQAIDTHTGGVSCSWGLASPVSRGDDGSCVVAPPTNLSLKLYMSGKSVADEAGKLMGLFKELLYESKLDDQERVVQMLKESKSGLESGLVSGGNRYATTRLSSKLHAAGIISEITGGLEYYDRVCELLDMAQKDFSTLRERLEAIRILVAAKSKDLAAINLTADKKTLGAVQDQVKDFVTGLGLQEASEEKQGTKSSDTLIKALTRKLSETDLKDEGVIIPTQVNYVGFGGRLYEEGERVPGSTAVITNFLRTGYLWEKVRVIGGAYGAGFSLNARMGTFSFSSYRDPNVKESLENYKRAAEYLIKADISDQEVERSIIGTISDLDYPQTPRGKGSTSFSRYFTGYTEEDAQKWRDEVLATRVQDFRDFGFRLRKAIERVEDGPTSCVFGSSSALEKAMDEGLQMELRDAFAK